MGRTASFLAGTLAAALLAACAPSPVADGFEANGEVIAMGGGAAGVTAACVTCHGINGQGDGNRAPRIAGLDPGYAARQLVHFETGARRHPQMEWISRQLGMEARQKVVAYYAALPAPDRPASGRSPAPVDCAAAVLYHVGAPARGVASCASCHGSDGAGNAGNPPLSGQPAPYLAHQLDAWANGKRYGDGGEAMIRISRRLSHRERQAVADYAARLRDGGASPTVPAACLRTHRPDRPGGA
ncbi:c-type cytochrome [Altererythrobacter aerius]|uniref:C-type cytochrome n=1 Tax=Tsuneonella aeria TaxID=1837929 RepID=A0A6I4TIZ9_9SPHN|nr:c-type cytochrome [Tsuneonella aeria]